MTDLKDHRPQDSMASNSETVSNHVFFLKLLAAGYLLIWGVMAISPVSRVDWLIQNATPSVFIIGLMTSYKRFRFSTLSYLLITLFMILHVIGSHYTYAQVPLGDWMKDAFGLNRNGFDRIVHFCFGLLLTHPLCELLLRGLKVNRTLAVTLSVSAVVGLSAVWEILESWLAQLASPGAGLNYLGAQGDVWDAQNDMAAALYGSLLSVIVTIVAQRLWRRETSQPVHDAGFEPSELST
jgi:putative membrane protein